MKRNVIMFIMGVIILFSFTGCSGDDVIDETDAMKFKNEYEKLNGKVNEFNDKEYRVLEIEDDNSVIYKSALDIVDMMDGEETFVVYFGFSSCPWCRSVIEPLMEVVDDLGISSIYYVDVHDIRDTMIIDEDGSIVTKKDGTKDYYRLLEKMDAVLEEYTLIDEDGDEVLVGEKRIYAPNIVSVVNGEALKMTDGIADSQDDPYMELTSEMEEESYDKIKCSIKCVADSKAVCSSKTKC